MGFLQTTSTHDYLHVEARLVFISIAKNLKNHPIVNNKCMIEKAK